MNFHIYPPDARQYLKAELELRQQRRPQYSLRAFARDLSMSPSTLSDFLHGKLGLSKERVRFIGQKLNLSNDQQDHFCDLLEVRFARKPEDRKAAKWRVASRIKSQSSHLPLESLQIVADWYHMAILELLEIDPKFQDPSELAKHLRIPTNRIKHAIERLIKVGLLEQREEQLIVKESATVAGDEMPSSAIRQMHLQVLALTERALEEQTFPDRDDLSVFFTIRKKDYPDLQRELRRVILDTLQKFSAKDEKDSLYCFNSHLFSINGGNP